MRYEIISHLSNDDLEIELVFAMGFGVWDKDSEDWLSDLIEEKDKRGLIS